MGFRLGIGTSTIHLERGDYAMNGENQLLIANELV